MLLKCNIIPLVVIDGGMAVNGKKLRTVLDRTQDQIKCCNRVDLSNQSSIRIYPAHATVVFVKVIKDLGVRVVQCDFEADEEIAMIAQKTNSCVISNDSDFFIFDVSFVLLNSLNYTHVQTETTSDGDQINYIPGYKFDINKFSETTKLSCHLLPALGTILGNDYISPSELATFFSSIPNFAKRGMNHRHGVIRSVIHWLKEVESYSNDMIIEQVLKQIPKDMQNNMKEKLYFSLNGYLTSESVILPYLNEHFPQCSLYGLNFSTIENIAPTVDSSKSCSCMNNVCMSSSLLLKNGTPFPAWIVRRYRNLEITSLIVDILTKNYIISPPQIEVKSLPSAYLIAEPIIIGILQLIDNICMPLNETDKVKININSTHVDNFKENVLTALDDNNDDENIIDGEDSSNSETKDCSTFKWYLRQKKQLYIHTVTHDDSKELCPFTCLDSMEFKEKSVRKQYLLDIINEKFTLEDTPDQLQFILLNIIFWWKNSQITLKNSQLETLIMCVVMFYVIDGKEKMRKKSSFCNIDAIKDEVSEYYKKQSTETQQNETIQELLLKVTKTECLLASYNLFQYHHLDKKLNQTNYDKLLVHAFSEFQACVYAISALNGLLCDPYKSVCMDRIWNGTFAYNILTIFNSNSKSDGFIEKVLGKNTVLYNIYNKLSQYLTSYLGIQQKCHNKSETISISKKNKKKNSVKITKASRLRKKESEELDEIVQLIENNKFFSLSDDC